MKFNIITIFPHILDSYLNESIIRRAQKAGFLDIRSINLRDFTYDAHKTTDDAPYGGGPGMVMKVEPWFEAIESVSEKASKRHHVVALVPDGRLFDQRVAEEFSHNYDEITFVCGRYEGFDERVFEFVDEKISIGKYVLCGGELPAMVIIEAVARLIPGVLGDDRSVRQETFSGDFNTMDFPQYTRPDVFSYRDAAGTLITLPVPSVLRSGNHAEIEKWRAQYTRKKTS